MTRELLQLLASHLAFTGLPGVAALLCAARFGVREVPVLLAIFLAACGIVGMLGFWAYFGGRLPGESFAYLVLLGSLLLGGFSLVGGGIDRSLLKAVATPLALWALGSTFLLLLGFMHGGTDAPLTVSANRFSHTLPGDNYLPFAFADWIFEHGHHGQPPLLGDWHFSDRPPLQSGFVVTQRTFDWDPNGLNYQVLGVVLQQLWIVGLWALLVAAKVSRLTRALVMITVLVSGLAIVNGFYVWPKLLPAAMLLGAAALVMTPLWNRARSSLWAGALIAALCALAMLGHGSSVFGIIPLAILAAYRGLPSWRWLGVGVLVGALLLAPWSAYQRFEDPPGNRLLKWQLGGVLDIDDRGALETIVDSYRDDGIGGTLHHKGQNFVAIVGGGPAVATLDGAISSGGYEELVGAARNVSFYYLLPSLGLLLLGPLTMAFARGRGRLRQPEWSFALRALLVAAIGAVAWGLLIYGTQDARAVIHVGSYLVPILLLAGCVVGLRATLPRFAVFWVAANAALGLVLYVPSFEPPSGSTFSLNAVLLSALALAAFVFLALRGGGDGEAQEPGLDRQARAGQPPLRPDEVGGDPRHSPTQVRVVEGVDGNHVLPAVG